MESLRGCGLELGMRVFVALTSPASQQTAGRTRSQITCMSGWISSSSASTSCSPCPCPPLLDIETDWPHTSPKGAAADAWVRAVADAGSAAWMAR
eukprot:72125-Rhodomonas_salina.6